MQKKNLPNTVLRYSKCQKLTPGSNTFISNFYSDNAILPIQFTCFNQRDIYRGKHHKIRYTIPYEKQKCRVTAQLHYFDKNTPK
jgi:hypothetical protein